MFDILLEVIAAFLIILGTTFLVYGLYSLTVRGFSVPVRIFSFTICFVFFFLAALIIDTINGASSELLQRYSGSYSAVVNGKKRFLRLKEDGTFRSDTAIIPEAEGTWSVYTEDATIIELRKDDSPINWYNPERSQPGLELIPMNDFNGQGFRLKKN